MLLPALLNLSCNIYDSGTSKPVVQELVIAVKQRPKYSETKQGDADHRKQITRDCLLQANPFAHSSSQPQFPGLHCQGLSTVSPEPDEISAHYQQQIELVNWLEENGIWIVEYKMKNIAGDKQYRDQE